ncbi:hypothetical protein SKAU_G00064980 [Synaphobranchus kaupii]|uniref:Uncharacterized protein n=1 Tax=Synaphobranchus kaupii TaxID=118154 RepID=A0A9Q1JAR4_SYNKA|nr:hypothetical protein SKAU_G00064980 [Synaphobranchus kaupii]
MGLLRACGRFPSWRPAWEREGHPQPSGRPCTSPGPPAGRSFASLSASYEGREVTGCKSALPELGLSHTAQAALALRWASRCLPGSAGSALG